MLFAGNLSDTHGHMFQAFKKGVLKWVAQNTKNFSCPKCGSQFPPSWNDKLTSWTDKIVCHQCGHELTVRDAWKAQTELKVNPPGPFAKPVESKIERRMMSSTQLLFHLPASGRTGGMLSFAVIWNAISWVIFLAFLFGQHAQQNRGTALPFIALFPLIGLGLAYAALRMRCAVHLLYLSPDQIRLQRQLFGHAKNFDLVTSRVESVRKTEFYQKNYQPVYGIEIKAPDRKIRFGSVLTDDEKNWLCWEIREFIKPYAEALA